MTSTSRRSGRWLVGRGRAAPARKVVKAPRLEEDELEVHEVWRTPGHVVEQGLWGAVLLAGVTASVVVDLGAGSGPFGQRLARVLPRAERVGIEIRESERRHLRRNYDRFLIGNMFEARERLRQYQPRLVVSNPPYTRALSSVKLALDLVPIGGHVLFFLRSTWGSSAEAWQFLREQPPIAEFSVAGRPNMRLGKSARGNPLGGDFVPHTWLLWRRGYRPRVPAWKRYPLPPLASEDLRWRVLPGTEAEVPAFPAHYLPEEAHRVH